MEFEALLLRQLTASLNISNDDDDDKLFGGDSGTGLAKQLFSEQIATAMSRAGGVGLAAMLVRQTQGRTANQANSAEAQPIAKPSPKIKAVLAETPDTSEKTPSPAMAPVRLNPVAPLEAKPPPPVAPPQVVHERARPAQIVPVKGKPAPAGYTSIVPFGMPAPENSAPQEILRAQFAPPLPAAKDSSPRRR